MHRIIKLNFYFLLAIGSSYSLAGKLFSPEKMMPEEQFEKYVDSVIYSKHRPSDDYNPDCDLILLKLSEHAVKAEATVAFRVFSPNEEKVLFQSIYNTKHIEEGRVSLCVAEELVQSIDLMITVRSGMNVPGPLSKQFTSYQSFVYQNLARKIENL